MCFTSLLTINNSNFVNLIMTEEILTYDMNIQWNLNYQEQQSPDPKFQ